MNNCIKSIMLSSLLMPTLTSSICASTSREITFDVTQFEQNEKTIFFEKLSKFFQNNSIPDGKEVSIIFETKAPITVNIKDILIAGDYEIKFANQEDYEENKSQKEDYRGEEQYAKLIESLAKDGGINLRLYDKLKTLTLEKELLQEVSKFEHIDRDNSRKLIEACLRTVKMNAVERYKTVDDLVETTFIEDLCKTVGATENAETLRNTIYFYTDIPINDVTDEELYQKMCDRLKNIFSWQGKAI